jgi:hypothetical protein
VGIGEDQAIRMPDRAGPCSVVPVLDLDQAAPHTFHDTRHFGIEFLQ